MTAVLLYATTFLANAVILVFEIAGARLLAPYLGTSVEVWSGTIAVILGGMAIGYSAGGVLADRHPSKRMLALLVFAAGIAALVAWATRELVPALIVESTSLPLTFAACLAAFLLFAPTTVLLASISPFIAKLLITSLDSTARTVGTLNAAGTAGSIAGALLSGAFLIPTFGLGSIFLGIAILLLILSLALYQGNLWQRTLIVIFAAWLTSGAAGASSAMIKGTTLADISTPYNRVWVIEEGAGKERIRYMKTDPFGLQCAMRIGEDGTPDDSGVLFYYLETFDFVARATLAGNEAPQALFLGGCNYSYPRAFLRDHPSASATVVEIDPGMTEAAKDYFALDMKKFPGLSIVHEDARRFAAEDAKAYDIIFMDTFGSSSNVPHHLTTKESFETLRARLAPGGTLVVNLIASGDGPFAGSLKATAETVFPEVAVYGLEGIHPSTIQNFILVAGDDLSLPDSFPPPSLPDLTVRIMADERFPEGMVLTDDYAPVEYLTRAMRAAAF